jgi:hypothetical protein
MYLRDKIHPRKLKLKTKKWDLAKNVAFKNMFILALLGAYFHQDAVTFLRSSQNSCFFNLTKLFFTKTNNLSEG